MRGQFKADMIGADFLKQFVHDAEGEVGAVALAAEVAEVQMAPGDVLVVETPGGGGFGPP